MILQLPAFVCHVASNVTILSSRTASNHALSFPNPHGLRNQFSHSTLIPPPHPSSPCTHFPCEGKAGTVTKEDSISHTREYMTQKTPLFLIAHCILENYQAVSYTVEEDDVRGEPASYTELMSREPSPVWSRTYPSGKSNFSLEAFIRWNLQTARLRWHLRGLDPQF